MESAYKPLLRGVALAGYRSFASWQEILLPTKVTVLAGINNSGKSNVLRFLQNVLPTLTELTANNRIQLGTPSLSELDLPRGFATDSPFEIGVPLLMKEVSDEAPEAIVAKALRQGKLQAHHAAIASILSTGERMFWARYDAGNGKQFAPSKVQVEEATARWPEWDANFEQVLSTLRDGGNQAVGARNVMTRLLASIPLPAIPPVATIAGSRRVEVNGEGQRHPPDWSTGRGIIEALFELQLPTDREWDASQASWLAINRFVQTVLGDSSARLAIPHDRSTIQVVTTDRVLPLSSLGSGVEQVVILAAAATVVSGHLVCVEEPETNLHPLLQKKLLRYLVDETDNQYVIATHSSHFLDDSRVTAYNVRLTDEGTKVTLARRPHELVQICNDLGYRPSDLQQANCVIWVEGPSDRTYVRRWLELVDPGLAEGIHYSIMFYGGKLLSHLTTSDEALRDFISLRRLNRSSAILIDSDRKSAGGSLNATKRRIQKEFLDDAPAPGSAWITAGYTIENYLPGEILEEAVKQVQPRIPFTPVGRWENPLPKRDGTQFDKIAIAQVAAGLLRASDLSVLGLRKKVQALSDFVRAANGHSTAPDVVLSTP